MTAGRYNKYFNVEPCRYTVCAVTRDGLNRSPPGVLPRDFNIAYRLLAQCMAEVLVVV